MFFENLPLVKFVLYSNAFFVIFLDNNDMDLIPGEEKGTVRYDDH